MTPSDAAPGAPTLASVLRARVPLTDGEAATVAISLARALDERHAAGIVHGPLTADDVLLTADGAPVLAAPHGGTGGAGEDVAHLLRTVLDAMAPDFPLPDDEDDEPGLRPVLEDLLADGCRSGREVVDACFAAVRPEPVRLPDAGALARVAVLGPRAGDGGSSRVAPGRLPPTPSADETSAWPASGGRAPRPVTGGGRRPPSWASRSGGPSRRLAALGAASPRDVSPARSRRSAAGHVDGPPPERRRAVRRRARRRARVRAGIFLAAAAAAVVGVVLLRPVAVPAEGRSSPSSSTVVFGGTSAGPVRDASDPVAAASALTRRRAAVLAAGDVAGLGAVDLAGGAARASDEALLASIGTDRPEGLSVDVQAARRVGDAGADEADVLVTSAMSPYRRVTPDGTATDVPGTAPRTVVLHLRWTDDGWRVVDVGAPAEEGS